MDIHKILILMFALVVVVMLVIMLVVVLNKTKVINLKASQKKLQTNENNEQIQLESKNNINEEVKTKALESVELTKKNETKKQQATQKSDINNQAPKVKSQKTTSKVAAKYNVVQNKNEKSPNYEKWGVSKQGSQKTIKYHNSEKEATAHAEALSKNISK